MEFHHSEFEKLLAIALDEEAEKVQGFLLSGSAKNQEEYKYWTGTLSGIKAAKENMRLVRQRLNERE
jgi:hypothetical protein